MAVPITFYADVNVSLTESGLAGAALTVPAFINSNSVDSNTIQGPYTSAQDVLDAGFASGSAMHNFATALAQQNPRPAQFYSVRESGSGYAAAFTAAMAENAGFAYGFACESRADSDILALAAAVQSTSKIYIAQSNAASLLDNGGNAYTATFGGTPADGDYTLTFTGFGLGSPVDVDVTRSGGSPSDNAALGVALDAALDTAAAGSLSSVLVAASISNDGSGVVSFETQDGLDSGTVTVTDPESPDGLVVATVDADIGSNLLANSYGRTSLWYHPTDSDLLAERVMARCLSADLDTQQISWSFKRLVGVTGTQALTSANVTALRNVNCNYFAPTVSSQGQVSSAFTAPGWVSAGAAGAGRPVRVQTTVDWFKTRAEERLLNMWLREPNAIFLDKDGIGRVEAVIRGLLADGLAADHIIASVVPEGEDYAGEQTPYVEVPKPSAITTADRAAGILRMTVVFYIKPTLEKVVLSVTART